MKNEDKNFEEFFRNAFEGAELTPSNKLWQNISDQLDKAPNRKPFWWMGGVAASLIVFFIAYVLVYNPFGKPAEQLAAASYSTTTQIQQPTTKANNNASSKEIATLGTNTTQNHSTANHSTANNPATKQVATSNTNKNQVVDNQTVANNKGNNTKTDQSTTKKLVALGAVTALENNKQTNNQKQTKTVELLAVQTNTKDKNSKANEQGNSKVNEQTMPVVVAATEILQPLILLTPKGYATLTKIEIPLLVVPISTVNQNLQVAAPTQNTQLKWELGFLAAYQHFQPNFSGVNDAAKPYPFVSNSRGLGFDYSANKLGQDLVSHINNTQSFAVGLQISRNLIGNFGLRSGLLYNQMSYEVNTITFANNPVAVEAPKPNVLSNQTQLLSVPLLAFYQQQTGKLVYGVQLGMQTDVLLQNTLTNQLEQSKNHVYSFGSYNSLNFNGLAGLKVGYLLMPHWLVSIEGNYRKALHSVYDNPNLQATPHWLQVGVGLGYKF